MKKVIIKILEKFNIIAPCIKKNKQEKPKKPELKIFSTSVPGDIDYHVWVTVEWIKQKR